MVIVLNIGNTHTQVAELVDGEPRGTVRFETSDLAAGGVIPGFEPGDCFTAVVACVVPLARKQLVDRYAEAGFHFVSAESVPEVDFSLVDTSTLGADRVANTAVIAAERLAPAIVLDCGTAITTEVVDAEYRFRGGAIMPGRRLLRRVLKANTGQLPEIPFCDDTPPAVGVNTAEAIRAGIDLGVLGAVQRVIDASRAELGESCPCAVYAVGGDAAFFAQNLAGVERGVDDFTMRGLALIAGRLGLCREAEDTSG